MRLARQAAAALLGAACALGAYAATPDVSTRRSHTLAIDVDGNVYGWGSDTYGQLGAGRTLLRTSPAVVAGIPAMASVAAGRDHALAIDNFGNVWSWGSNDYGQLGPRQQPIDSKPGRLTGVAGAQQVAAGSTFSAALRNDGTVWVWGLGLGATSQRPVRVLGLSGISKIAAGSGDNPHLLALKPDGSVFAIGANAQGQLGDNTQVDRAAPVQVIAAGTGVVDIAAGQTQSLALKGDGTVLAWGTNTGAGSPRLFPQPVAGLAGATAIAAVSTSFAVVAGGAIVTWDNAYTPGAYPGAGGTGSFAGITQLSAGAALQGTTVYGLGAGGTVSTFGANGRGQRGLGNTAPNTSVTIIPGGTATNLTHISGGFGFAVARRNDGAVLAWGSNESGTMGDITITVRTHPVTVASLPLNLTAVRAGSEHSLALDIDGNVWAWGRNDGGQLGAQFPAPSSVPIQVPISNVAEIAAGCQYSLFRKNDNTVWFVGRIAPAGIVTTPTQVTSVGTTITAIAASCDTAFAIRSDGQFYVWGTNDKGQFGDGTTTASRLDTSPALVSAPGNVIAIDSTDEHVLALRNDGSVWAWGKNGSGELGNGGHVDSNTPVAVTGLASGVAQVAAGSGFSMARLSSGVVRAWGRNTYGTVGDGTRIDRATPVLVPFPVFPTEPGLAVTRVAAGAIPQAVRDGGTTWGWGRGLTGDGKLAIRTKPAVVLREGALGNRDGAGSTEWFLDLDVPAADRLPDEAKPNIIPVARATTSGSSVSLTASINFRFADYGKNVGTFIFGRVPPAFLSAAGVELSPVVSKAHVEALQKAGSTVLVQLTPQGWSTVSGQLVAYTSGVINANGGANNILNGVPLSSIPGAQFCIGYGESAGGMLSQQMLAPVLDLEGAATTADGLPCVLSGVYVNGPATSSQGALVTFEALVVGVSPTGTVQMRDDGFGFGGNLGTPLPLFFQNEALATGSFTTSTLAPGVHSIGATYSGDAQNPAVTAQHPLAHVVAPAQLGTTMDMQGPASSTAGQLVSFTARVFGNAPTGNVQFKDNGVNLGAPVPLFNSEATISVDTLTLGAHTITASYAGDGGNAPATTPALAHTVYNAIVAEISLTATPNPVLVNTAVTLTATVTGNNPTGVVTFRDNGAPFLTTGMNNGVALYIGGGFAPGVHTITADYGGDANNATVSSPAVFLQVDAPAPPSPTTTALASSVNPTTLAQVVTFTATVAGSSTISTGTVAFQDGFTPIAGCTAVPVVNGTAACSTNVLGLGAHSIVASYSGATGFEASMSAGRAHTVNGGTAIVTANPASIDFGGQSMNTTSQPRAVTLTNGGGATITVTSLTTGPGFTVASHNCGTLIAGGSCQANLVFTPGVQGAMAALLGVNHTGGQGPSGIPLAGLGEKSLATHYYWSILRRAPDAGGKAFWDSEAVRMQSLGANINEAWYAMAQFFYFSAEYLAFNRDNTGFITDLYTSFFNRAPDGGGLAFWVDQIAQGMPREVILASFMFSPEFTSFTQAIFGNTAARAEVDVVMDFYRGLLARLPDNGGFNSWVGAFRTAQCQGAGAVYTQVENISTAFVNSVEYTSKNRSNAQYVGDLYNAFLRRGGDLQGVQFWINKLDTQAMTRDVVRQNFIASAEFQGRVNAVVNQGCLP